MDLKLDTLRTTTNLKNILSRIKGVTGIQHWNVLCRWGLSLSLKQKTLPRLVDEKLDGVEIDFDVFVGTILLMKIVAMRAVELFTGACSIVFRTDAS